MIDVILNIVKDLVDSGKILRCADNLREIAMLNRRSPHVKIQSNPFLDHVVATDKFVLIVQPIYPSDDWLDTETRAILCNSPPTIQTAVGAKGYSLLFVRAGPDESRAIQAVAEIRQHGATNLSGMPAVIAQQLTLDDAMAGQFALSCCDCISAFVADEVVCDANADYLRELTNAVTDSPEFEPITVKLVFVPPTTLGRKFCWQFLGVAVGIATPSEIQVHRKKARLMLHWAARCDVDMKVEIGPRSTG